MPIVISCIGYDIDQSVQMSFSCWLGEAELVYLGTNKADPAGSMASPFACKSE